MSDLTAATIDLTDAEKSRQTLEQQQARFWAKVDKTPTGCWLWTGYTRTGYGLMSVNNRRISVHRLAYEWLVGPISDGLVIDHLCRVRNCVRPDHLEAVSERENILRGEGASARAAVVTHCPSGHPYDDKNTHITPQGYRRCRTCHMEQKRLSARRRRALLAAPRDQTGADDV